MNTRFYDKQFGGLVCQIVKNNIPEGSLLNVTFNPDEEEAIIVWPEGSNILTWQEILQEVENLKQQKTLNAYKELRAAEYPSIADQLDTLYHGGYDAWKASIDVIKNKYPKPTE